MQLPGGTELLIILVIVILLFGVGRISKVAGEFGKGIRAFKDGLQGTDENKEPKKTEKDESSDKSS
jgi:sec-independent protein translocase protein TatA